MPNVMTTFEDFHDKLEMVREIGSLIAHIDSDWGEVEGQTLNHVGSFIWDTMIEFQKAMYEAHKEKTGANPDGKEAPNA